MRNKLKWPAVIFTLLVICAGLPFYLGYGNPLPFINPDYSLTDNIWLMIFPLMFAGLAVSLKLPGPGGFFTSGLIAAGIVFSLFLEKELPWPVLVPLAAGILNISRSFYGKADKAGE